MFKLVHETMLTKFGIHTQWLGITLEGREGVETIFSHSQRRSKNEKTLGCWNQSEVLKFYSNKYLMLIIVNMCTLPPSVFLATCAFVVAA